MSNNNYDGDGDDDEEKEEEKKEEEDDDDDIKYNDVEIITNENRTGPPFLTYKRNTAIKTNRTDLAIFT